MASPAAATAADLLRQVIELERQSGPDAPDTWDVVTKLRQLLATLPSRDVFALIDSVCHTADDLEDDQGYWACISELRHRNDHSTFAACATWTRDAQVARRRAAAHVLRDFGNSDGKRRFAAPAQAVLEPLLEDSDVTVVTAALYACGELNVCSPDELARFASHSDAQLRYAVAFTLGGRHDPLSTGTLIDLTHDVDASVRNWATFGLAQQTEVDTPAIRAALLARIDDSDLELGAEIRGEALIGLAARQDPRVLAQLERELAGEFHGAWCIKAASMLRAPSLGPLLAALKARLDPEDLHAFGDELDAAIAACGGANQTSAS
ncbi:MAG: hypothetical protein ACKVP7_22790 [Hyphomicrobiaceae bacterium]